MTDAQGRALNRRLALGGMAAARLLTEGVLDQDKRVRQQFRKCLEPLFASPSALSCLDNVERNHSRAWLFDVLIDNLLEQSESENIGAAAILGLRLPDDHAKVRIVLEYFDAASHAYKSTILQLLGRYADPIVDLAESEGLRVYHVPLPQWMVSWVLKQLMDPSWLQLRSRGVKAALRVLSTARDVMPEVLRKAGLDTDLIPMAISILCGRALNRSGHLVTKYIAMFRVDYEKAGPEIQYDQWSDEIWDALEKAPGIFSVFNKSFRLARNRTSAELQALSECVKDVRELSYDPSPIAKFVPSELLSLSDVDAEQKVRAFFQTGGFNDVRRVSTAGAKSSAKGRLSRLHGVAVDMIGAGLGTTYNAEYMDYLRTPEGSLELLCICQADPPLLLRQVGQWGELFALNDRLRAIVRDTARTDQWRVELRPFRPQAISAFELELPTDSSLLVYIVRMLSELGYSRYFEGRVYVEGKGLDLNKIVSKAIEHYVPIPCKLVEVVDDDQLPKYERAAAAIMYLRHPNAERGQRSVVRDQLISLYTPESGFWMLPASAFAVNDDFAKNDALALKVIASLLELARADLEARCGVEPILKSWREISRAPVQTSQEALGWR